MNAKEITVYILGLAGEQKVSITFYKNMHKHCIAWDLGRTTNTRLVLQRMKYYHEIFNNSYLRVAGNKHKRESFFKLFYKTFLSHHQAVKNKFKNTDLDDQRHILQKSFDKVLKFAMSQASNGDLEKIAIAHNKRHFDITPEYYDIWLDSLMETVKESDLEFCDDVELSWRVMLAPGIALMKHFYDK